MGFESLGGRKRGGSDLIGKHHQAPGSRGRGALMMAAALIAGLLASVVGLAAPAGATGSTPQTISFGALPGHVYGDAPFTVSATASSGLAVTFSIVSSTGACDSSSTNGATITVDGAGTCTVQADQSGNATFAAAPSVDQSFTVTTGVVPISISNLPGASSALVGESFSPSYNYGGDGAPTVTSSSPSICSSSDDGTVFFIATGTCKLVAHATATNRYQAATGATQTFTVSAVTTPKCTRSWAKAVNGNWSNPSNWAPVGVPTSSDNVCIAANTANYTVTLDVGASLASLSVGSTAKTETLDIASQSLSVQGNFVTTTHGAVLMDTSSESILDLEGNVFDNAGSFVVNSGGSSALFEDNGSMYNLGTFTLNGTLDASSTTFVNATGGAIRAGSAGSLDPGRFVQAGGTSTGNPLSPSTLVLAGGGAASFSAIGMTVQGGPLEAGQSIDIPTGNDELTLANDLTSDGTITMETDGPSTSFINLNGHTLTNAGTFDVSAGSGGSAEVFNNGTIDNTGTVQIAGSFAPTSTSFTNAAGGSVAVTGVGSLSTGTYTQAGGTSTGNPLSPSTLVLAGGGAASFSAIGMTVQGGPLEAGQSIDIPTGNDELTLANDLTSDGTITMETDGPSTSFINLNGHTLTNAGTFDVSAGSGGSAEVFNNGTIDNTGTVQIAGSFAPTSTSFTNAAGGSVAVTGVGSLSTGTYTQAGGTSTGNPLSPSTLVLAGGGAASFSAIGMTVQGGPLEAGQSIDIPTGNDELTLANDLTSDGTITMETDGPSTSFINLNGHTLTNAGTFDVSAGSGGSAEVFNNGTIDNTGTVQIAGSFAPTSTSFTNAAGGSVAVTGVGSLSTGTYTQAGGTSTGNPLSPSTLVLAGGGAASFSAIGMTVQGGPLEAGQSIDIPTGNDELTLANDLTSDGTITMETDGPSTSFINLNGHTLTNAGTFDVSAGSGGSAEVFNNGTIDNTGTVQVNGQLDIASSVTNGGSFTVGSGQTVNPGTYSQTSGGVTNFVHDAAGNVGSFSSGSLSLGGCVGTSGPNLPTDTVLSVITSATVSGPVLLHSVRVADLQRQLSDERGSAGRHERDGDDSCVHLRYQRDLQRRHR